MAEVLNIFQAAPEPARTSSFDLDKLTEQFKQQRNTDWSVPESFLCLLLSAAAADGNVALEEQAEIHALVRRSRVYSYRHTTRNRRVPAQHSFENLSCAKT